MSAVYHSGSYMLQHTPFDAVHASQCGERKYWIEGTLLSISGLYIEYTIADITRVLYLIFLEICWQ